MTILKWKMGRLKSKVWKEFERYKDEKGVQRCKCKHCGGGNYKCESGGYGTKNLGYHLTKCKVYLAKLSGGQTQLAFQYGDENKLPTWKFDQNESQKALAHMLVVDELPFSFVEGAGFRYYNSVTQPLFKVPCRSTSTTDVYQLFIYEKEKNRDFIIKNVGRICLTTDTWTSKQQSCYMCLTAHFIDNEWKLKKKSHRGVDIGKMVEKCLTEWEIENVFTISVDNASAKDFSKLQKCGKWMHIRCIAHNLNLVVQDGIKKVDKAVEIVRWAVKWIRQPPSRIHKFTEFAKVANPGITKHLKRDVPTRWNSTYHMLEIAQAYQKTFERYDLDEFDFWCEIEKAGLSIPSSSDWERARNIYISFVRSWMMLFPSSLCDIALARNMKFDKYFGDIEKMNLLLYFALILDPRNKVKYLVILLEDRYGEKGVEAKKKYIMDSMYELYNDYIKIHSPSSTSSTAESTTSSLIIGKRQNPDFMAPNLPLRNKLREKMKTNIVESIGELEKYLQESVEDDLEMFSILDWWKVNSSRFMVLSLMARDVFVIPVSTVASESVFSTSGRVLDPFRSSLTPKIVESLICTQDWIQGSISDTIDYEKDWEENQQIDKGVTKKNRVIPELPLPDPLPELPKPELPEFSLGRDREMNQILARGRCENGLYVLHDGPQAFVVVTNKRARASYELWHSRLGHAAFDVVSFLNKMGYLSITSVLPKPIVCSSCQLSKGHRLSFDINNKRFLAPLDFVHCDLWGPSPVISKDGYNYYVVFIDDFSRLTWFYPLKTKFGFYTVLSTFVKFV
uniref:BED-type domain-containing protein n=1 Tax=Lactuca sativa TaxID=4236 RepID=A0A9R1X7T2_LACSA|nr:hypothetical protein LSAT_V11C600301960 [Lactuca sativa]